MLTFLAELSKKQNRNTDEVIEGKIEGKVPR
jgi:hypothetical protein